MKREKFSGKMSQTLYCHSTAKPLSVVRRAVIEACTSDLRGFRYLLVEPPPLQLA